MEIFGFGYEIMDMEITGNGYEIMDMEKIYKYFGYKIMDMEMEIIYNDFGYIGDNWKMGMNGDLEITVNIKFTNTKQNT